jgi:hypothetical protein
MLRVTHRVRVALVYSMNETKQIDALEKVIRIQQQMILDLRSLSVDLNDAVAVMSALDTHFCKAFFARKVGRHSPSDNPMTIPSYGDLMGALASLGGVQQDDHGGLEFFCSLIPLAAEVWSEERRGYPYALFPTSSVRKMDDLAF